MSFARFTPTINDSAFADQPRGQRDGQERASACGRCGVIVNTTIAGVEDMPGHVDPGRRHGVGSVDHRETGRRHGAHALRRRGVPRVLLGSGAACLAVAVAGCGASHAPSTREGPGAQLTPKLAQRLTADLRSGLAATNIAGVAAAVVFPDGREWSGAAGEAELRPRTAMTPHTSFSFDDVTKVATAALAMRLAERGRLRLDDPIRRWYPAWRGDPRATVRDLLGHTSGMGDPPQRFFTRMIRHPHAALTPAMALAATPRPGPRTRDAAYSNSGFILLGLILRRVAGEPVATAMRHDVFDTPGGNGLALQPQQRPHPPLVHPYFYPQSIGTPVDASDGGPYIPTRALASVVSTAGGLAGDVPSLARWGHALLAGHILAPRSLRAMTRFHDGGFWTGYGLGLAQSSIDGHPMWGHGGDGLGTHTELWHLPREDLTVVVSWNDDAVESRDDPFTPKLVRDALGTT